LFPHIIPIAFPLIFPLGLGLAMWLFKMLLPVFAILLLAALVLFIIRTVTLGNPDAALRSMRDMGRQWQQRFTTPRQQTPYYQPSASAGETPSSSPYGQGYQPEQPYYRPTGQSPDYEQPQPHYPEQMPPMQQ
jgi:hypothetical protein